MRRINEIFYSLQGEGHHTGRPSVFVRFSGCNLNCHFCDTEHQGGRDLSDGEIYSAVRRLPGDWVVLTGGEPSLWIDESFVRGLQAATGRGIAIETNGTRALPPGIDWVTVSPKSGGKVVVDHADEIKVVDLGQDLEPYFALPCRGEETLMYLQPCHVADPAACEANIADTVRRVLADPRWRLSLQTHRIVNIK